MTKKTGISTAAILATTLAVSGVLVQQGKDTSPVHQEASRSTLWPKFRADYLKTHPACEACGTTESLQLHHCKPYHLFPDLELVESNVIVLCEKPGHLCHFRCGHALNWKAYNPHVREDAALSLKRIKERKNE